MDPATSRVGPIPHEAGVSLEPYNPNYYRLRNLFQRLFHELSVSKYLLTAFRIPVLISGPLVSRATAMGRDPLAAAVRTLAMVSLWYWIREFDHISLELSSLHFFNSLIFHRKHNNIVFIYINILYCNRGGNNITNWLVLIAVGIDTREVQWNKVSRSV